MAPTSSAPTAPTFADLWPGALRLCRRLGLKRLHILSNDGRPIATFERREDLDGRIDDPADYRPDEPAATVALVLACGRRTWR